MFFFLPIVLHVLLNLMVALGKYGFVCIVQLAAHLFNLNSIFLRDGLLVAAKCKRQTLWMYSADNWSHSVAKNGSRVSRLL
jgi:hypothetical protein